MRARPPALLPAGVTVLERGWLSSNTVVMRGSHDAAIVDTGYWSHAAQTISLVEQAAQGRPPVCLVNTHLHSDHCGGNAALQAHYPLLRTLVPAGQAEFVRRWDPVALTYEPTGQHCPPFQAQGTLAAGSSVRLGGVDWEVHAAPGHDPHSIVLFESASRTLIAADALWEDGFGVVFPELEGERAFDEVAQTLSAIERLQPAIVIPGHGRVFTDVQGALERARSRLDLYRTQPERHAAHAAKVLLKFKLLELQQIDHRQFVRWAATTPYLQLVHANWFAEVPLETWISELLQRLEKSAAVRQEAGNLINT